MKMSIQDEIRSFKAKECSQEEQDSFERELYQRVNALSFNRLTRPLLALGATFVGYLYNTKFKMYLTADSDNKWVYATSADFAGALRFSIYSDSRNNTVVAAQIGTDSTYLNWRNVTGAVKLYDSYDNMSFTNWNDTVFQIYSDEQKEIMGSKDNKSQEMYYKSTVYAHEFEYHYINQNNLGDDERLIWRHYLKHYPDYMSMFSGIKL